MAHSFEIAVPIWRRAWLFFVAGLTLVYLILPVLIVIPMSFSDSQLLTFPPQGFSLRWYQSFFESVEWMDAAKVSIQIGLLTVVLATPLGTAAAYGLSTLLSRWSTPLRGLILAPMIVPIIIVAIGIFYLYARIGLVATISGLVLAHTMLAIPFVTIVVTAGLERFDRDLERAALSLGANRIRAFFTVTLPQIRRSILSAALIAFITSLDEVVVAIFISLGEKSTLTRRMFASLRDQIDPTIAAISTLLIAVSIVVVVLYMMFPGPSESQRRGR